MGRVQVVPHLCMLYPGILLATEIKSTVNTLVKVVEKCQLGTIHWVDMAALWVARKSCWSCFRCFRGPGSMLSQRTYLPSSITKGFPTSANFESNLLVRSFMWLVKKGTPKSSWICLLPVYQGALVTMQRHLDWSTCSLLYGSKWWTSR